MIALLLAAVLAAQPGPFRPRAAACETGCDERGCWLLIYRYVVNEADPEQPPAYVTKETFDEQRFPTEDAAYCRAKEIRTTGVKLPTLGRFGRDSNVMPESITPMPHLGAVELGIRPAHTDSR